MKDIFAVTGITEGDKVRLMRFTKGLRQIDVASMAKVNVCDVTALEKNRYVLPQRRKQILAVLGIYNEDD
ncbi:hypothetical protein ACFLTL_01920 [Chloroflexota bacterium]